MAHRTSAGGGTTVYLLGSLAEGVFSMAFTMVLVRLITPADFGAWRQFMVLASIVWNIAVFGLPRSLIYFYSTADERAQGAIARRTLWLTLSFGCAASILFYFGLDLAAKQFDSPGLADEALLFSSFLLLCFPTLIINPLLLSANRRTLMAVTKVTLALLRIAALIGLVWFNADLQTLLISMNVFALVQFVALVALYLKVAGPALVPLWANVREQMRFSADVTATSIAGQIAVEADKLIVSSYFPPARFASYSVGARELPLIPMIPYSISDSISPEISRLSVQQKFSELRELWHRWMKRTALLMYPVFALVLFQHREIITILYTSEYLEGALPLLIIGCIIPMRVTSYYQMLLNLNGSREVMSASIAMLISIVALSFVFLYAFGMWGPALAVAISEYLINTWVVARIARRTDTPLSLVMPWAYLLKLLVVAVGSGALALPVLSLLDGAPLLLSFAAYALTLLVLYAAVTLTLRMVSQEDLALLRSKFRR